MFPLALSVSAGFVVFDFCLGLVFLANAVASLLV